MKVRRLVAGALLATLMVLGFLSLWNYVRAAALVARASRIQSRMAVAIGGVGKREVRTRETRLPATALGVQLRTRIYEPAGTPRQSVVLTVGVHALGIDEPRLVAFARDLSASGMLVVTPELPDLLDYRITPRLTDQIEDAARWLATRSDLAPAGRIGLIGISFSGGLSVVAAGRQGLRDRVSFVLSLGGHGDMSRVLHYLCGAGIAGARDGSPHGRMKEPARTPRPHDYGVVIVLYNLLEKVVPADQVEPLRQGVRLFLKASHVAVFNSAAASAIFKRARDAESGLPEPAVTLLRAVNQRDVARLGAVLLPHLEELAGDASLSAELSPRPLAPVYLLHGADDNVIPPAESLSLAGYLEPGCPVRCLLTPLITHADVDREIRPGEAWELIRFWKDVLGE